MTRPPLIRQGEGQTAAIQRLTEERAEQRRNLESIQNRILAEIDEPKTKTKRQAQRAGYRSSEGDRQRLRAIPVIAPSISGTIPGTNPLAELIRQERLSA